MSAPRPGCPSVVLKDDAPERMECPVCYRDDPFGKHLDHKLHLDVVYAKVESGSGWKVFAYCLQCQDRARPKKGDGAWFKTSHFYMDRLPHARSLLTKEQWSSWLKNARYGPCEACRAVGALELHHWAPAHLFGNECDSWPVSMLCHACHKRWHEVVTPNMRGAR